MNICPECDCDLDTEGHDTCVCEAYCPVCRKRERPMSEYGIRYRRCDDCEDGDVGYYDGPTLQEQYERAWDEKRRLG